MEVSGFPADQNIFGRAARDTHTAMQLVRFKLAELISGLLNVCISIVVPPMILPELTGQAQAIVGAIAVSGGALAMIGALFCEYLILAPYRQRDEARATLSQDRDIPSAEVKEAIDQLRNATVVMKGDGETKDMATIFQGLAIYLVAENDTPSEVIWRHLDSEIGVFGDDAPSVLSRLQTIGLVRNETRRILETWNENPPPADLFEASRTMGRYYPPKYRSETIDKSVVVITPLGTAVLHDLANEQ